MQLYICAAVLVVLVGLCAGQTGSIYSCKTTGNPCLNGGTCTSIGRCSCADGFERENCRIITARKCTTINCGGNGQCVIPIGSTQPECSCDAGYSGTRCENSPMSCQCTTSSTSISMTPPGNFNSGSGYVNEYIGRQECSTNRVSPLTNTHTKTIPFFTSNCGNALQTRELNGDIAYSRTFYFRYNSLRTQYGILFTCKCIIGQTDGVLYVSVDNLDGSNLNNLIQQTATGYIAPITYTLTKGTSVVTATTRLVIGDLLFLTVTADSGYCVMIDSITANNTISTATLFKEVTLLQSGCRTSIGQSVIDREIEANPAFSEWVVRISAFLLDFSDRLLLTIRYRAYPSNDGRCFLPNCAAAGRKKRQAGDEPGSETNTDAAGSFSQVIIIGDPSAPPQDNDTSEAKDCDMSNGVLIGLIVMAVVICILLLVCFVVGMRMIMTRKRATTETAHPPEYAEK